VLETWIEYINGEKEFILWSNEFRLLHHRAIPERMRVSFQDQSEKKHLLNFSIPSGKLKEAQLKLSSGKTDFPLEINLFIPLIEKEPKLYLSSKTHYIEIPMTDVKFYTLRG